MILPTFRRWTPTTPAPLTIGSLVEWFDLSKPSKVTFIPPVSITNVTVSDADDWATITAANHGLIADYTGTWASVDGITISDLPAPLTDLNKNHTVLSVLDANTFRVASTLGDYNIDTSTGSFDFQTKKISTITGMSGSHVLESDLRSEAPFYIQTDARNSVRFIRRNNGQDQQRLDFVDSAFTDSQPFTLILSMESPGPVIHTYGNFLGAGPTFCGMITTAAAIHRLWYTAGTYRQTTTGVISNTTGTKHILAFKFNGASSNIWRDGGTAVSALNPGTGGMSSLSIGGNNALGYGLQCKIFNWALYSSALSNSDINLVANYFKDKISGTWTDL